MLSILGSPPASACDGQTRRQFLRLGGLALGGLTFPQILRAESMSGRAKPLSHKAVIMIYLSGGPSHQDMYDLKMDAPRRFVDHFGRLAQTYRELTFASICLVSHP